MIKVVDVCEMNINTDVSFTPEVKTYNILTGKMTDECKPFRIAQSAMMWIDSEGFLGEIECIYPQIVKESLCEKSSNIAKKSGLPKLEIDGCANEISIQHWNDGYIIWISKDKEIDSQIDFDKLVFWISDNELVAIKCTDYLVIE